jgi:hypothetical protein
MVERDLERLSIDTSGGWRWTFAYVAMLAGIFIAGAVTKASGYGGHHDVFRAHRVWLYATILTVGYMISRGLGEVRQPRSLQRRGLRVRLALWGLLLAGCRVHRQRRSRPVPGAVLSAPPRRFAGTDGATVLVEA